MTVQELINELSKYPGDWKVIGVDVNYWYQIYQAGGSADPGTVLLDIERRFYE